MLWTEVVIRSIAILANGLLAGIFFVFACAVVPGFRRVDDRTYVQAFLSINRAILNGWFLSVFIFAPLSAVVAAIHRFWSGGDGELVLLIAGAICSMLTFGITASVNVPLNRLLDEAPRDTEAQLKSARRTFETRWNQGNLARALTSLGAFVVLLLTIVL